MDKLSPSDSRIKHGDAEVEGHRWHYLDVPSQSQSKGVVVLVHGFPDISLAWRYQIPMLTSLGLRCIAIDCMGYGDTGTTTNIQDFTYVAHGKAIASICEQNGIDSIILGGHDWGGAVVYRVAQWYPKLVSHVFSVCTPYFPIAEKYISTELLVKGPLPNFGYQLQLGSDDQKIEKVINTESRIRKFLNGMYGGKAQSKKQFMTAEDGIDLSIIEDEGDVMGTTPLLTQEEMDYYTFQFSKNGVNGPCNWYRTRKANFDDERSMPEEQKKGVQQSTLFILALNDSVLKPEMAKSMRHFIPNLTFREVQAGHWALWERPKEVNEILRNWVQDVVFGGKARI